MNGLELLHTLWMIPIVCVFAYIDQYIIVVMKQSPDHVFGFVVRLIIALIITAIVYNDLPVSLSPLPLMGLFLLAEGFLFWLLFDPLLNLMRGLPWNYLGETAEQDKFLRRPWWKKTFTPDVMFACKLFGYLATLFAYMVYIG